MNRYNDYDHFKSSHQFPPYGNVYATADMTSRPAQQHDTFAPYLDTSDTDTDTAQGDDTLEDYLQSEARLAHVDAECRRFQISTLR